MSKLILFAIFSIVESGQKQGNKKWMIFIRFIFKKSLLFEYHEFVDLCENFTFFFNLKIRLKISLFFLKF